MGKVLQIVCMVAILVTITVSITNAQGEVIISMKNLTTCPVAANGLIINIRHA